MNLKKFDTFLLDLDDTLWRVSKLMPGAKEFMKKLRAMNKKVYFVTNNNIMTRHDTAKQLTKLGISAKKEEIINTGYVASIYLKKRKGKVLALGQGLEKELKENGIKVSRKLPVGYVIIGDDLNFHFNKIALVMQAIKKGAKFVACNMGRNWYIGDRWVPGVGSLAISISYATGIQPIVIGKPHEFFIQVTKKFVKKPSKTVVIGDSEWDVIFAKKLKCKSVLVSSKSSKRVKPEMRVRTLKDLLEYFRCKTLELTQQKSRTEKNR